MFGQIPIFGQILGGGSNEGLVGLTYEVAGPPSAPVLRVNPISVFAPGLFRKFLRIPDWRRHPLAELRRSGPLAPIGKGAMVGHDPAPLSRHLRATAPRDQTPRSSPEL